MSNRHRRTRIYGANYDIGESYYKKQLNDLDSKKEISRSGGLSFEVDSKKESKLNPKVTFLSEGLDLNDTRNNSNIIRKFNFSNNDDEDHIIQERSIYQPEDLDISNKLRKTNAFGLRDETFIKQKKFTKVIPNDYDLDEEFTSSLTKTTREFSVDNDRYHNSFGNSNRLLSQNGVRKQKSPINLEEKDTSLAILRSKFMSDKNTRDGTLIEEDALRRANVSKARLLDLEEEIMSVTNKQNEREKRNKNLKKILSEVTSKQE